jgi:hypothetical protein
MNRSCSGWEVRGAHRVRQIGTSGSRLDGDGFATLMLDQTMPRCAAAASYQCALIRKSSTTEFSDLNSRRQYRVIFALESLARRCSLLRTCARQDAKPGGASGTTTTEPEAAGHRPHQPPPDHAANATSAAKALDAWWLLLVRRSVPLAHSPSLSGRAFQPGRRMAARAALARRQDRYRLPPI